MDYTIEPMNDGRVILCCFTCADEFEVATILRGQTIASVQDKINAFALEHMAKCPETRTLEEGENARFILSFHQGLSAVPKTNPKSRTQVQCPRPMCSWIGPQTKLPDHDAKAHHGRRTTTG